MPAETATREQVVQTAIREISHIATLPEITLKIVSIVEDPNSTAQDLHAVISKDPALCTRILKVVNSAFYGLPGQIGSINRAIVLLGLNAVKNIAIAASLSKMFKGGQLTPTFSAKDLWTHSLAVGTANKLIAEHLKMGLVDEAFLTGLLHDVGVMVEMQWDRAKLSEVLDKTAKAPEGTSSLEFEDAVFGANHQEFGAALSEKWKFPKSFTNVIGYHHRPLDLPADQRTLPCMIYVADRLAAEFKGGYKSDIGDTNNPDEILAVLNLSREDLSTIKSKLPDAMATSEAILG